MYIQFQSSNPGGGSFTTNDFSDEKIFLKSLGTGSDFKVYEPSTTNDTKDISLKKVIKKLQIETVKPLNKNQSCYLEFTAKDSEDEKSTYSGIISW